MFSLDVSLFAGELEVCVFNRRWWFKKYRKFKIEETKENLKEVRDSLYQAWRTVDYFIECREVLERDDVV